MKPTGNAKLTYYIFEGILTGILNDKFLHIDARSGGGAGAIPKKVRRRIPTYHYLMDEDAMNNPYYTGQKEVKHNGIYVRRGGPIPVTTYIVGVPSHRAGLGYCASLVPTHTIRYPKHTHRDGFYIHHRGYKGSDGCIVPYIDAEFSLLMSGLKHDNGGTLFVQECMGGDRFA